MPEPILKSHIENAKDVRVETLHLDRHEDGYGTACQCMVRATGRNALLEEVLRGQWYGSQIAHIPFGEATSAGGAESGLAGGQEQRHRELQRGPNTLGGDPAALSGLWSLEHGHRRISICIHNRS
jgi:hypothetical protein